MSNDPSIDAIRSDFIEKTGLISQSEGLPRIAGRIFGMLIFDGQAVAFADLATKLEVSRASVSSSIRLLEERGLIKRMTKSGDRQDYFRLATDPYATMLQGLQKRTQATRDEIAETIQSLPANSEAADRLNEYAKFHESKSAAIIVALETIRAAAPTSSEPQNAVLKENQND